MAFNATDTSLDYALPKGSSLSHTSPFARYACALFCIVLVTITGKLIAPSIGVANVTLLYLLPVFVSAVRWGRGPTFFAAFLGVLTLDFFLVPPFYGLAVDDPRDLATLAIFLLVGTVTGTMATRLRDEAERTRVREKRTLALYGLSQKIASETDLNEIAASFAKTAAETAAGHVSIFMPGKDVHDLRQVASYPPRATSPSEKETAIIQWVLGRGRPAGRGTDTLRNASELIFPAKADHETVAALVIDLNVKAQTLPSDQEQLIEAFANLAAVAIVRIRLAQEAERVQWLAESEKLHRALLNSISHDLRTPLASIMGAVTGLLDEESVYDDKTTKAFLEMIKEGAMRLNRLFANLLDMARLESDTLRLKKEWCDIQDIIGVTLKETEYILQGRAVRVDISSNLPLVEADFALTEHVLINLLENAVKYSPAGSDIRVEARSAGTALIVTVSDQGPSIPDREREHVFEKFYRLQYAKSMDGTGLGLSICRGIIEAHNGTIWLDRSSGAGNRFTFSLPLSEGAGRPWQEEGKGHVH